jgi:hypothetical protein
LSVKLSLTVTSSLPLILTVSFSVNAVIWV